MPPKKAKAKAAAATTAPPLQGCSIALSGTFAGQTHASIEQDLINALGGTLAKSVAAGVTHLIASDRDFEKPSPKVKQAQSHDISIVKLAWLEDCLDQKKKLKEDDYLLGAAAATASSNNAPKPLPKRPAATSTDSDDDKSQTQPKKKSKTNGANGTNGTKSSTATVATAAAVVKPDPDVVDKAKVKAEAKVEAENNITKSTDINIQLDETCPLVHYRVLIDDDGLIYDASLNQTNASNNNNKFYRLQLLRNGAGDHKTWSRWGRVGERGQSAVLGDGSLSDAIRQFDSKFKSKSGLAWADRGGKPKAGKYTFIERSYAPDSDDEEEEDGAKVKKEEDEEAPESKLDPSIQELMELIFNQQYFAATMSDLNYDAKKLPLGKLSKATITRGYQALKDLSALLDDPSLAKSEYDTTFAAATEQLSNAFYSLIPHAFGRDRPPIIQDQIMLKREVELLESLGDMKEAANIMKKEPKDAERLNLLDQQFKGLNLDEMTPLKQESPEFQELKAYLIHTTGATHSTNYQVDSIFRIARQGEKERFDKSQYGGAPRDRRLLWHGSRCTNFGGILSQGLRIAPPEAPVSGYMFGKGIYLADMSSKSANYCCSYISGGHALLLLCEAELGDPMQKLTYASYNAGEDAKAKGMFSTWGQGTTGPSLWKDAKCAHPTLEGIKMPDITQKPGRTNVSGASLHYNEYITYDVSQVRLRYLLRVRM